MIMLQFSVKPSERAERKKQVLPAKRKKVVKQQEGKLKKKK